MAKNQILTSSDHHANWDALEKLFKVAKEKEIPFVIGGDLIGDYNFEQIKYDLNLKYPDEIKMENLGLMAEAITISTHAIKLKALYTIIIENHAKIFAKLIDEYQVKTYFLLGNHEPANFVNLTLTHLENKDLLKELNKIEGIEEVSGFRIAGIPNVCAIMPFLYDIYSEKEIDSLFKHQRERRPILYRNVTKEFLNNSNNHLNDPDWSRIIKNENAELDVFFTHGQIGTGAWRVDKYASEMPTLHAAAKLSSISKLTVDGHLHSTHEMENSLGKQTARAVGNQAFILTKEDGQIKKELIKVDATYDNRGKINLDHLDLNKEILEKILKNQ